MRIFILILSFITLNSCLNTKNIRKIQEDSEILQFEPDEEGEYDIIVFDSGYDIFLQARALPMNYYSEEFLHAKNIRLVNEWNSRHAQPSIYNPNIYEVYIDYLPSIQYGLEFEWKLFNFFMFIETQTGEDLDNYRTYSR